MFKSFFEKILGKENNNKSKPKDDVKVDSLSSIVFPEEVKVEAIEVVKEISVELVKQQETKPKEIKGTRRSSGVPLQALSEIEAQLTVNGIVLFKSYKKGTIENPEQYLQIKESDRICYIAYNAEYKNYILYPSHVLVIDNLKLKSPYPETKYIIPANNQFYYWEGIRTEVLLPKTMNFKSYFYGEPDDDLEIVMYKNLMANQFAHELSKRGIKPR